MHKFEQTKYIGICINHSNVNSRKPVDMIYRFSVVQQRYVRLCVWVYMLACVCYVILVISTASNRKARAFWKSHFFSWCAVIVIFVFSEHIHRTLSCGHWNLSLYSNQTGKCVCYVMKAKCEQLLILLFASFSLLPAH